MDTKLGQNIHDHKISHEFDYGCNQIRMTAVICPWIRKIAIFDFVYTMASTTINPSSHMLILGSANSAVNKDMMTKICTHGDTVIWLSRKHCGKRRNCLLRTISPFHTMFSKAVLRWCVKMSIYGVKGYPAPNLDKRYRAIRSRMSSFMSVIEA